mgnify:CR=1 FL=1
MKNYTIREISEMFELPSSTLRYYESEGLLPEVPKSSSGQRIYSDEHVERLKCINCFKRTGMTIPQLRKFFIYEADEAAHIDKIISLLKDQELFYLLSFVRPLVMHFLTAFIQTVFLFFKKIQHMSITK